MNQLTVPLYNQDSHLQLFQAKVLTCVEQAKTDTYEYPVFVVTLDATAFFPEGGGQPSDTGVLGSAAVLDVQEDDGIIYHTLSSPLLIGEIVTGQIDWSKRFDLMQHHSAEHIIAGIVHKYYGYDNVGFHMGSEAITIDFNGSLTADDLLKIEYEANQAVYLNIPITVAYPSGEELKNLNYRSKKELYGNVRIVTIPGYDMCACCAPHVYLTGEIGGIKIIGCQNYKGGVRVSFLCGMRALQDYNIKERNVTEISVLLSSKPYEVSTAVTFLKEENTLLKTQLLELQKQILKFKASAIQESKEAIYIFDNEIPSPLLRAYGNLLVDRCESICGIFTTCDDKEYKYLLASKTLDIRPMGTKLNEAFQGRGGGSKEMVQGSVTCTREELEAFLKNLV